MSHTFVVAGPRVWRPFQLIVGLVPGTEPMSEADLETRVTLAGRVVSEWQQTRHVAGLLVVSGLLSRARALFPIKEDSRIGAEAPSVVFDGGLYPGPADAGVVAALCDLVQKMLVALGQRQGYVTFDARRWTVRLDPPPT